MSCHADHDRSALEYQISPSSLRSGVLVNGTVMVRDSEVVNGVFPWQPIRFPVEPEGRFVPLERESYLEGLMSDNPIDMGIGSMEERSRR